MEIHQPKSTLLKNKTIQFQIPYKNKQGLNAMQMVPKTVRLNSKIYANETMT